MQAGRIENATRVLGQSQGYMGLPVRDECCEDGTPIMTTSWLPLPHEIAAIVAGAPIHVSILGTSHPPIVLKVGEAP